MTVFADTSAVVKLYADEFGSDRIRAVDALYVSQLCRVELPAALWRKNRMNGLSATDARVLITEFENDLFGEAGRLSPIRITAKILDDASSLAAVHGLRAYDAVQLASVRAARTIDAECDTFAAFDGELREAGAREGFRLLPASMPSLLTSP